MTIVTTLKNTMAGALLSSGVLMSAVIFASVPVTTPATAHETNTIMSLHGKVFQGRPLQGKSIQNCDNRSAELCQFDKDFVVSAVTIYNRRHCHANGVCHKHRFTNPNHRH